MLQSFDNESTHEEVPVILLERQRLKKKRVMRILLSHPLLARVQANADDDSSVDLTPREEEQARV